MANTLENADDTATASGQETPAEMREIVKRNLFGFLVITFVLSVAANILLLVAPLYMLQVYDRVLTSGSVSTLISLSVIAVFLLAVYAFAEAGRRRALSVYGRYRMDAFFERLGQWQLSRKRFFNSDKTIDVPSFQDIARIQGATNAGIILPYFDVPFTPFFLGMLFLLHPIIGAIGLVGAILLVLIAVLSEKATSARHNQDQKAETTAQAFMSEVGKSSNAVIAMGMRSRLLQRWMAHKNKAADDVLSTNSVSSFLTGFSKSFRQILQAIVLGAGAYLALQQEMSPGGIVAGSIIMGRGLAPLDQIVGGWKQMALVNKSWSRLKAFLEQTETTNDEEEFQVQSISSGLHCQNIAIAPPGYDRPVLEDMNLSVGFGEVVGIVGASGAGKSTLLQCMAGIWPTQSGEITLGSRSVAKWQDEDRGRFIGYLPQRVELLPGTVADNISRFQPDRYNEIEDIAEMLGFQQLFMSLPEGYSTFLGETGQQVSAGQRQAIGLARACFGDTRLVLLDEPTANLDVTLSRQFVNALMTMKSRNMAVVLTTHDSRILPAIDRLFGIQQGRLGLIEKHNKNQNVHPVSTARQGGAT